MLSMRFLEVRDVRCPLGGPSAESPRDPVKWSIQVQHGAQLKRTRSIKFGNAQQKVSYLCHLPRPRIWIYIYTTAVPGILHDVNVNVFTGSLYDEYMHLVVHMHAWYLLFRHHYYHYSLYVLLSILLLYHVLGNITLSRSTNRLSTGQMMNEKSVHRHRVCVHVPAHIIDRSISVCTNTAVLYMFVVVFQGTTDWLTDDTYGRDGAV